MKPLYRYSWTGRQWHHTGLYLVEMHGDIFLAEMVDDQDLTGFYTRGDLH